MTYLHKINNFEKCKKILNFNISFPLGVKRGRYSLQRRTVHILEAKSAPEPKTTDPKAEGRCEMFDILITKLCKISDEHQLFSPELLAAIPHLQKQCLVCINCHINLLVIVTIKKK